MSQIINKLATIEVSDDVLQQLDIDSIYQSFSENYRKLDNLKTDRLEHQKKNRLMRWWHSDELQKAQLDSAEVQAEFSKTIGQLMMISIKKKKKLSEQQTQLNEQQGKLKTQADGIAEHAGKLQEQHHVLAEQSDRLEALVREYFELKGLTEEGAQRLIEIARDVKATKDQMLQEFASSVKGVEAVCADVQSYMERFSAQMDERVRQNAEQTQAEIASVQREIREALVASEARQKTHQEATKDALGQCMERLAQNRREVETLLQSKYLALESRFSERAGMLEQKLAAFQEKFGTIDGAIEGLSVRLSDLGTVLAGLKAGMVHNAAQQQTYQDAMATFQQEVSKRLKCLSYFSAGMSVVTLGILCAIAYLMKWI